MKTILRSVAFFALSISLVSSVHSQTVANSSTLRTSRSFTHSGERGNSYAGPNQIAWPVDYPLPPSVSIPGADLMPVSGHMQQQQSDGRALHNIQVDPSNPMNVHAVIMELASDWVHDTNFLSRRVYYTFSGDGGHTWKTPIALTNVKTGFPCMILYNRGGKYVPIIAAHRFMLPLLHPDTANTDYECALWVEKGNPGDGNFEMTECGTTGQYGSIANGAAGILWPYIAVSSDGSTVYMVGSVSFSAVTVSDFLRFGTFSLDVTGHAGWNGWNTEIGASNANHSGAGLVESGDYVLRVSPAGKLGLLWRSSDYTTPEANLYFIESTDGGNTWPQTFEPIQPIVDQQTTANGSELYTGPWTGLDFFYNGENAKILWSEAAESFNNDTNTYYPSEIALHLFDVASGNDFALVSNFQNDTAQNSLYGLTAPYPVGSQIKENDDWLDYPTIAQSTNPNIFSIFYQTFNAADSVQFDATTYKLYASIYSQTTSDGGATWTAPTPFRTNSGPANTYSKIDYRWPQASDWSSLVGSSVTATLMYGADTAAGTTAKNGASDWDIVNFFHDTLSVPVSSVSINPGTAPAINLENYPNPFASSVTIQFTLPSESVVLLTVSDMLGRTVETLANGRLGAGEHTVTFNGGDLPNGVYRYTLRVNGESVTRSMSLLR